MLPNAVIVLPISFNPRTKHG